MVVQTRGRKQHVAMHYTGGGVVTRQRNPLTKTSEMNYNTENHSGNFLSVGPPKLLGMKVIMLLSTL